MNILNSETANRLRDWLRGWSEDDLDSLVKKIADTGGRGGSIIKVTPCELRAFRDATEELGQLLLIATDGAGGGSQ